MIIGINFLKILLHFFSLQIIWKAHPASSIPISRLNHPGTTHRSKFISNYTVKPYVRLNISDYSADSSTYEKLVEKVAKWLSGELHDTDYVDELLHADILKFDSSYGLVEIPVRIKEKLQIKMEKKREILETLVPPKDSCDSLCDYAPMYPIRMMWEAYLKRDYVYEKTYHPFAYGGSNIPAIAGVNITNRNEFGSSRTICNSEIIEMFPKIGKNKVGELRYILNIAEHKQSVQQEICSTAGNSCDTVNIAPGNWPFYKLVCEQQQIYSKFDALDPIKKEIVEDLFLVKNGCCCKIE